MHFTLTNSMTVIPFFRDCCYKFATFRYINCCALLNMTLSNILVIVFRKNIWRFADISHIPSLQFVVFWSLRKLSANLKWIEIIYCFWMCSEYGTAYLTLNCGFCCEYRQLVMIISQIGLYLMKLKTTRIKISVSVCSIPKRQNNETHYIYQRNMELTRFVYSVFLVP